MPAGALITTIAGMLALQDLGNGAMPAWAYALTAAGGLAFGIVLGLWLRRRRRSRGGEG